MTYKYRLSLVCCLLLVVQVWSQERITIYSTSGKNEISHEKSFNTKSGKVSSKPLLVIQEPQYEKKTSVSTIKERAAEQETGNIVEKDNENYVEKQTERSIGKVTEYHVDDKKTHLVETDRAITKEQDYFTEKPPAFVCPSKNTPKPFLALPCSTTKNCGFLGQGMLCCDYRCVKGVKPPKVDHHEPLFFGIIERRCPVHPLTELSEVQECIADEECSPPRICCGEKLPNSKGGRYCKTPIPIWDTLPLPSPVLEPLKSFTSYLQCTPPPPPLLDLYPKTCQNPMDCFPNLCCQENGKKFCRPPKKSLLALVAELGQRIIPEDAAKKFIERIS